MQRHRRGRRHDVRVTRPARPGVGRGRLRALAGRAAVFARRVSARYASAASWWVPAERVHARGAHWHLHQRRLVLQVGLTQRWYLTAPVSAPRLRPLERVRERALRRDRLTTVTTRPGPATTAVLPLLLRQTRQEWRVLRRDTVLRTVVAPPAPPGAPPPATPPRLVAMVVRHSTVVVPAAPAPASGGPTVGAGASPGRIVSAITHSPAAPSPRPIPLSPGELRELTDQVVGALDRRAVAHRERMGNR